MCGLVTAFTRDGGVINTSDLQVMTDRIRHRGPDDFGYVHVDPEAGVARRWRADFPVGRNMTGLLFGFRRLSIIDLSDTGSQPMVSDDGRLVLAFNGEIYNFLEIRTELEALGVPFRGRSDTEVFLRAYEQWGEQCFARLNGMWAITLWDGRCGRLIASRDRFGVKPLYYAIVGGVWIFASEVKALLAYPGLDRAINQRAVFEYLAYGAMDHAVETCWAGIRSVRPGTYVVLGAAEVTEHVFWKLSLAGAAEPRSDDQWVDDFADLFADAVRLRVRSDVPVGTMLSGGLDSTSITAMIHEPRWSPDSRESTSSVSHHAFSACWPGWINDEEAAIGQVGERFGLNVHKVYLEGKMLLDLLPKVIEHLDAPFMTPVCLVQFELMRTAREHGVKVVLNGHGSDEILGGYADMFATPHLADLFGQGRFIRFVKELTAFRGQNADGFRGVARTLLAHDRLLRFIRRVRPVTNAPYSETLAARYPFDALYPADVASGPGKHLTRALHGKFAYEFVPQWLRMEDRMSMAWSVESRLPFMDYRLVQLAFDMPNRLKLRNGYNKYVLRRSMQSALPAEIVGRRSKRLFGAPHAEWFRTSWRRLVEDSLLDGRPLISEYLDLPDFRRRLRAWLEGQDAALTPNAIWRALSAEIWLHMAGQGAAA